MSVRKVPLLKSHGIFKWYDALSAMLGRVESVIPLPDDALATRERRSSFMKMPPMVRAPAVALGLVIVAIFALTFAKTNDNANWATQGQSVAQATADGAQIDAAAQTNHSALLVTAVVVSAPLIIAAAFAVTRRNRRRIGIRTARNVSIQGIAPIQNVEDNYARLRGKVFDMKRKAHPDVGRFVLTT